MEDENFKFFGMDKICMTEVRDNYGVSSDSIKSEQEDQDDTVIV
jgi:hypothetical protein